MRSYNSHAIIVRIEDSGDEQVKRRKLVDGAPGQMTEMTAPSNTMPRQLLLELNYSLFEMYWLKNLWNGHLGAKSLVVAPVCNDRVQEREKQDNVVTVLVTP